MTKKSIVLAIALLAVSLGVVQAQSNNIVAQGNSLADKFAWLQAFAQSNNSYILEVNADERISSQKFEYRGKSNIIITLRSVGTTRTINLLSSDSMFTVESNVTLILDNITLRRTAGTIANEPIISVDGTLIMNNGSNITGNQNLGYYAVWVTGNFVMTGGTIARNFAGVLVSGGTFTMNGGTISDISMGSGVQVQSGGTFVMNNGTITRNYSIGGGGVSGNSFTMNGGTISDNTAEQMGGGVAVGNFTMNGGIILNNIAYENGGGVYVWDNGIFIKTGGIITGYADDPESGNVVKISTNTVQNYKGHAVFVGSDNSTIKIKDGTAGPGDNLSYNGKTNPVTFSGAWDN